MHALEPHRTFAYTASAYGTLEHYMVRLQRHLTGDLIADLRAWSFWLRPLAVNVVDFKLRSIIGRVIAAAEQTVLALRKLKIRRCKLPAAYDPIKDLASDRILPTRVLAFLARTAAGGLCFPDHLFQREGTFTLAASKIAHAFQTDDAKRPFAEKLRDNAALLDELWSQVPELTVGVKMVDLVKYR